MIQHTLSYAGIGWTKEVKAVICFAFLPSVKTQNVGQSPKDFMIYSNKGRSQHHLLMLLFQINGRKSI